MFSSINRTSLECGEGISESSGQPSTNLPLYLKILSYISDISFLCYKIPQGKSPSKRKS